MSDVVSNIVDADPIETREWLDALSSLTHCEGQDRARFMIHRLLEAADKSGVSFEGGFATHHRNTIAPHEEPDYPGDLALERKIRSSVRWNGVAMVVRANAKDKSLGGHLASYMSSCTLYEVGFNHFFRAASESFAGDLIYFQGHITPGIYARSFLEGRLTEDQMDRFRQEVGGRGLSSYPHPYLMPDYWQFSTVSMGLGPIQAIYQARLMKYMDNRGLQPLQQRKVWAFLGDGECDEPETLGALNVASRERLDNLIFVINCNLQRLDGPVRGNGSVMSELERTFRGAGWNVFKVVWGSAWDRLLNDDHTGLLQRRMDEAVDGEYQNFKAQGGAYTREHFFGKYDELAEQVASLSDEEIQGLIRGGHDPVKVHAAYRAAMDADNGRPTVILAHTVKGYGMGSEHGEADMEAHNIKTMTAEGLRQLRDRFQIPVTDEQLQDGGMPYYRPATDSPEMRYLQGCRERLHGFQPARRTNHETLPIPTLEDKPFAAQLKGTGEREVSTTMAFVRVLSGLTKFKPLRERVVPIVPDEARTFGMEGMFRQLGIYAPEGQKYEPVDAGQIMFYREDQAGQILEEGITESGAMSSWIAAATSHANHGTMLIPFYFFYAMFGFQRIGDLAWAAGDMMCRGFMVGGTAGRTTINGEGLQHQDGHSHLFASVIPNCRTYDPTYAHEVAVIVRHGLQEMYERGKDIFFYLTVMNENYPHPAMPDDCEEGIVRGMYLLHPGETDDGKPRVQLLGSGTILREVEAAAEILSEAHGVTADVWSVTSFNELRREALDYDRQRFLAPGEDHEAPWVKRQLADRQGPVVAATDSIRLYADQIRAWVPSDFHVLGTDGFGRSDTREALRRFFEVDRYHVVTMALWALAERGEIAPHVVSDAMTHYGIDPAAPNPLDN
ncbi:pyruvate dehydrogenase (acetyl-transferring), homodimeric type [Chromohalobacter canadensis]|uniref:pyruvate dehydrogenase (acetyl-transferring), homodimeric type n=1 Tax=Chromohalobacter canadensis TaxID=141389 RepID=UPI0021C14909|nr:pyruvate dehydrogenase (acetyl-transferring), homodimeric type [Chromohalobacter canadensis]MCT8467252.1 pyruvate dehydrogenase (acetyl-transferring), homodimeric type [Chromohalobacter canadensis]MCT8471000.1 pyruvate dehydrogenase (acetyl-transferring), homodimeric type [Chromohalobacter canadensis]MCT8497749.1 pyruvate dehydrogenase (acetyl-transferring), homodimeric type [Chromohalobacter canadensis]